MNRTVWITLISVLGALLAWCCASGVCAPEYRWSEWLPKFAIRNASQVARHSQTLDQPAPV